MLKASILLMLIFLFPRPPAEEPVRAELIRQQQQTGLTMASFYRNLATQDFSTRSSILHEHVTTTVDPITHSTVVHKDISIPGIPVEGAITRDGEDIAFEMSLTHPYRNYLAVMHPDGTTLREYRDIASPNFLCWSFDKSKLAGEVSATRSDGSRGPQLVLITLSSGAVREFDASGYLTSQCWSPHGEQLVYGVKESIRVYDIEENHWRELAKGEYPTWSPDGNWIAFADHDSYYVIRPDGADRKLLFKSKDHIRSGLWWSPDGKVVAYYRLTGHWFNHSGFAARQLRVRRLADNSDDWIAEEADVEYIPSYQWVQPSQSVKTALNKP